MLLEAEKPREGGDNVRNAKTPWHPYRNPRLYA